MGMSVSPQIWQQFVDLVFQDDLIKRKQNFDVIMDDSLYIQQLKSTWISHGFIKRSEKIRFKTITSQMSIFQKEDSLHGIRISNSRR